MAVNLAVPLVLLPRYTTLAGPHTFTTTPIPVVDYAELEVAVWRGLIVGAGSVGFEMQESMDLATWYGIGGSDPGEDTEIIVTASITRAWLRARIAVIGSCTVSWYGLGALFRRRR